MNPRDAVVALLRKGIAPTRAPLQPDSGKPAETDSPPLSPRPALALAPMATITHEAFRRLVHKFGGCDLYFTEMISAEALLGGTPFESYYRSLEPVPDRTIYQLIGYSADSIAGATEKLRGEPCAGIDINMGCSAPHLVRKGAGIAWMSRPDESARLVATLRRLLPDRTLSVKLRLGRNDSPEELLDFTRKLVDSGIDFLTLHPKKQKEGSARPARWSYVDLLTRELPVPVIGNGGITDWESYRIRSGPGDNPRAAAVMIGRGAVRAPWLFSYLRGREDGRTTLTVDLSHLIGEFLSLLEAHQPPEFWPSRARRVYPYLFRNVPFGHSIGARLSGTHDYELGKQIASAYFSDHPERRNHVERN